MGYILNLDTISEVAHQLKKQGKSVVFTHGAFDLFHTGHSYVMESSKKTGDVLIVGVEPNKNIAKYKDTGRPILDEKERLELVAAHKATDFVFLIDNLDEATSSYYLELYKSMSPNSVTFGPNSYGYQKRQQEEKIKGIRYIKLQKLIQDPRQCRINSTTEIINKIRNLPTPLYK